MSRPTSWRRPLARGTAASGPDRSGPYTIPDEFPRDVGLVACDLDGTLLASDLIVRDRTRRAIAALRTAGVRVAIATGRMFQSALPYARAAGIEEPIICYQGAAVVEPATRVFLRHEPIPLSEARDAIAAVQGAGYTLNAYVDDELYVAAVTPEAERYAVFQDLEIHPVGDLLAWLSEPPTKLVAVGAPEEMDALKASLVPLLGDRLHISKSLPIFLELSRKGVTKGSGLAFLADRLAIEQERVVAFGDAENDVELLEWAGYGVAMANADEGTRALADLVCPSAEEEGVAQVLEAYLART
jgi:Cof subfamily protein (haloacid dehalogenase superfamily)